MKTEVRGKNGLAITKAIEAYCEDKLSKLDKYLKEEAVAYIVCKVYNDHHKVEVTIPTKLYTMRAEVSNDDMYAAIDLAIDKLESQIRKHKEHVTRSLQRKEHVGNIFRGDLDLDALREELIQHPIKEKELELEPLTRQEAVSALELVGHSFFIFKDADSGNVSVLYKRNNGEYGCIETKV